MSCELTNFIRFQDIKAIKRYLYPVSQEEEAAQEEDLGGWDDAAWEWKEDEEEAEGDDDAQGATGGDNSSCGWIQECPISLSPTTEFMALAHKDRLVLLAQKWDPQDSEEQAWFSIVYQASLAEEKDEEITSLVCLPLASQKRSSHGGPDWTCLIVGFSTGYVRMYTENGTLLLSQIFSEEPVQQVKCRTYEPPRHSADAEKHEELNILYKKHLVVIDGFSLYQTLKACRNQVARAAASGAEVMQPPPLAYKKWNLQGQDNISDFISCGMRTPNPFDQMQTASMIGGYSASIRATPPAMQQYVTAGSGPYVGVYCAVEGSTQPMLSDVAHAVAHKLKSALFSQISAASGWFGFGSKQNTEDQKEKKRPKIEPATTLPSRFGLPDKRRQGESIVLAPHNNLAATTDSFGRVMLLDLARGMAVRIWKGYRDAQVGWVSVKEELSQQHEAAHQLPRQALFLIIYAPRRGILEVWTAQKGMRVAAFNVSKTCRLLCPGYGMMGLNNVTCRGVKLQLYQCALVDPDGMIKLINVPFHLALSDKNSKRVRDMHLLKRLKVTLKDSAMETEKLKKEILDILFEIKIPSLIQQGLERVFHCKYLSVKTMSDILTSVRQNIAGPLPGLGTPMEEEDQSPAQDVETRVFLQYCKAKSTVLDTYAAVSSLNAENSSPASQEQQVQDQMLCSALGLNTTELGQLKTELDAYSNILDEGSHVTFAEDKILSPVKFLQCFESTFEMGSEGTEGGSTHVSIREGLSEEKQNGLAAFLYGSCLQSCQVPAELATTLKLSGIPPESFLHLLLHLWLSTDKRSLKSAIPLYNLIKQITSLKGSVLLTVKFCCQDASDVCMQNSKVSPWWQLLRSHCFQSQNILAALLAAFVGRTVAIETLNGYKADTELTSSSDSSSEWETVTLDGSQWTLLIKQLEDLLQLQCLLKMRPQDVDMNLKAADTEPAVVSVRHVMEGGRGVFAELVAKWVASQAVPAARLYHMTFTQDSEPTDTEGETAEKPSQSETPNQVIDQLLRVQHKLPYSLDVDILLANCCWEYAVLWNKDLEVVSRLEQSLNLLKLIQNPRLAHGVASMLWNMFLVKRVSAAAFLMEKVGKSPKERLCRRDVGLSDLALQRFMGQVVELLDVIIQASTTTSEFPPPAMEDPWQNVQGPTPLVELAVEQKESNLDLVQHHSHLAFIMNAGLTFNMKTLKPLSLYDTAGRGAFFRPLHCHPTLPANSSLDAAIINLRTQFLNRVITQAILTLGDPPATPNDSFMNLSTAPLSLSALKDFPAVVWPDRVYDIARQMDLDLDVFRRHHVCELYSSGFDKQAEEVLRTVNDHRTMGTQLLMIAGQRLAHFIFVCDPPGSVEKLSQCSPTVSSWLKNMKPEDLRHANIAMKDTLALVGQAVNQLPESHSEYNLAISLIDLVQSLM